jgi:hypothetical protein
MSSSHPRQPPARDAARTDSRSTPVDGRELPEFQPHTPSPYTPMDREIERSERASAALAATRALARASFTDSQLAADDAAGHDALDDVASSWVRTEYVAFDPTPQGEAGHESPRHLIGGSFNPGIASQQGRLFPAASIAQGPIRTRSGAMARFAQESRHAPRAERGAAAAPRPAPAPSTDHYEKPAVMPVLASARPLAPRARQPVRSVRREPAGFLLAAALGAAVVLVGGGFAWKAGLLARQPDELAVVSHAVAARAEAARLSSQAQDEIPLAPAAGLPTKRSDAEVDAALAAAARAAAVPAASVRAAGTDLVMQPLSAVTAPRASGVRHAAAPAKDNVDAAVANARARANRFLAPAGAGSAASPGPRPEQ